MTNYRIYNLAYHELLRRIEQEENRPHGEIREYRLTMLNKELAELHKMILKEEQNM